MISGPRIPGPHLPGGMEWWLDEVVEDHTCLLCSETAKLKFGWYQWAKVCFVWVIAVALVWQIRNVVMLKEGKQAAEVWMWPACCARDLSHFCIGSCYVAGLWCLERSKVLTPAGGGLLSSLTTFMGCIELDECWEAMMYGCWRS